jgi:hypothetical protein
MKEDVQAYVLLVQRGKITLEQVPQEIRLEVEQALHLETQEE